MERKQPSLELPSTTTAEVAANRYIQEQSLEDEEELAMKTEEFEELHVAIANGDIESVRSIVQCHPEERYFSFEDTSALYKAFQCKEYNIISLLIHRGAKFAGSEEEKDVYDFGIDLDLVNHLLYDYNRKSDKACVYRLMSLSQSPQGLDGDRLNALKSMLEHLFQSEIIKMLMNVLESVDFDIVFDFESDTVNRVHRLDEAEAEIFGLTLSILREIFIGGKDLLSRDPKKKAKVYGVVAEELCHLALTTVFQNNAKPYKEEDSNLIQEFKDIVRAVKALTARSCRTESVIRDVFEYYNSNSWECELIARVPHVIAIYGEKLGREKFQESSELSRLYNFYDQNVHERCKVFCDLSLNTKCHRMRKQLMGKNESISFKEKQICPLREHCPSFREYAVVEEGVSVISTNCIKLSILHVYHDLKPVYGEQLERKCLFFGSDCFEKNRNEILNAFKCNLFKYLVLVLEDQELQHRILLCKYLDHFQEFENRGKNIIIISNSQFLRSEFEKTVEYKWDDLTDEYKDLRTQYMEYIFKGERWSISIKKEDVHKLFSGEDIFKLISGDLIEVRDHADLNCQGYKHETYVERQFQAPIIDKNIFERLPNDTSFLIYGLSYLDIELSINKRQVQWLKGSDDVIQEGKAIFINNYIRPMNFKDFVEKTAVKNTICLQYYKKMFYLMNSEGDVWKQHKNEIRQSEGEIIDWLKSSKTLIISDNAGCGKSTVMSRLIWLVRKEIYNSWVLSVDLNKFSIEDEVTDSEEDVYDDIFDMLGFENGLEKFLFMYTNNQENYFIFLDALDEIQSKYKTKALKLIAFLRKKTNARIIITTRMHHQQELEKILNTFSHQLVPFDNLSQVNCLGRLWMWKLKFPSGEGSKLPQKDKKVISRKITSIIGELEKEKAYSESRDLILAMKEIKLEGSLDSIRNKIGGLEFSGIANYILKKTSLDKETVQFMGTPLHLFMIGVIYFDSNFKAEISSGIYSIYSKFIDQKVRIYVVEKQGIFRDGREKEEIMKLRGEDAYRIHIELANQLMDKGKKDVINMSKDDLELCASLGIVFINGERIDFLHHTFAEYFRAESIRLNLKKEEFFYVLLCMYHDVVRRFLFCALEEKNFENLTIEFFEDLEFIFSNLKRLVKNIIYKVCIRDYPQLYTTPMYTALYSRFYFGAKIVKSLLEIFENTVDLNCWNEFVLALRSELLSFDDWYEVGGCLTLKMMKILLNQNDDNLKLMFGVVKYYTNPKEIIELMSECISIENSGECDSNERENENGKAKSLLKVLMFKDSDGNSLLKNTALNMRMEVFVKILGFSKEILGKQLLVNEIIGSREYKKAMNNDFIDKVDFNGICELLKTFHSDFGKEIEIFFNEKLKFNILRRILQIELSNEFEEIINLFDEYFGIQKLKEVLLSYHSKGEYFIHYLFINNRSVIKNLNIVSSILFERSEMKQFLMIKNRKSMNIIHYAAINRNVNFGDFLEFCGNYLEKHEILEMLNSCDDKNGALHLLFINDSSWKRIIECFDIIKNTLADKELFKQFLKGEDKFKRNIFHFAAINKNVNFGEIMKFCCNYFEKHEIEEMLISCDEFGSYILLHLLFRSNSSERIIECLDIIKNTLDNDELFKKLLKGENKYKMNIFHFAPFNLNEIDVSFISSYLCENEIKELLIGRNEFGRTFLHFGANEHSTNLLNLFEYSFEKLKADEGQFEELILAKDEEYGDTFLHRFVERYSDDLGEELVINLMKSVKEKVSDENFKELLRIRNVFGETFLQVKNWKSKINSERVIKCFTTILEESLIEELLKKNENDENNSEDDDDEADSYEDDSDDDELSD